MFQLTAEETEDLRCQIGTSSWGGRRYLPYRPAVKVDRAVAEPYFGDRLRNPETQAERGFNFVAAEFRGYVACPRNYRLPHRIRPTAVELCP